ncbi:MAG: AAA-like domain-containing protein, partial [Ardenticatenaceae bacterium]
MSPFKAGGPLSDERAAIYIEREADRDVLAYLEAMEYLMLIEPRQQGKTSLLAQLRAKSDPQTVFGYIEVEDLNYDNQEAWFADLWDELLLALEFIEEGAVKPPTNLKQWRNCLRFIASLAEKQSRQVVIALDEVGSMAKAAWADSFFASLRKFYNQRAFVPTYKRVTFILVGSFHPRDLIKDKKISPFNVAKRVRLPDFTLAQVRQLVSQGGWSDEQSTALAERIHYWTDGQPYLTQLLCSYLGADTTPADVDAAVERLSREDKNHLLPLLERLASHKDLIPYIHQITSSQNVPFYPAINKRHAQLELLGVLKADAQGVAVVRNRIYEQALSEIEGLQPLSSSISAQDAATSARPTDQSSIKPTIGLITALPKEFAAMRVMLDNVQRSHVGKGSQLYFQGKVPAENGGQHDVILGLMSDMGTNPAAVLATRLLGHFPTIKHIIMVGIAGGVPYPEKPSEHVRLGDVVVSDRNGVVQYDFDKESLNGITHRHPLRPPSAKLLNAVRLLEANSWVGESAWLEHIERASHVQNAARPPEQTDILVDSNDQTVTISHPDDPNRVAGQPRVFTGRIASANKLLKNPQKRDYLRDQFGVKAIEMEGSGIADATWNDSVGYLVVRGICDY